jgi:hypothetical protein
MDTADIDPNRPRSITEMAGDWTGLQKLVTRADPPHIVLVGPAGVGKSCALKLLLRGQGGLTWLRCSQDPTLRESRDRIKDAARRRVTEGLIQWIVLEHADLLHTDAQTFLRRIIETSLGACRFVLEVRDVAAIAEPLLSRTVMTTVSGLMEHEIRTEIMRRAPAVSMELANRIAAQSGGNVRWAILQGLGGGDGFIATDMSPVSSVKSWATLLQAMEQLQASGTSPRAWLESTSPVWERPGGACPWAITAKILSSSIMHQ